jgi:hypothetical protein
LLALYIIGGIVLFFLVLLFSPVVISANNASGFSLRVRYLFVILKYPKKLSEKKQKKAETKKNAKDARKKSKPPKKQNKKSPLKELFEEKGKLEALGVLKKFAFEILGSLSKLIKKHLIVKKFFVRVVVGAADDAAQAHITYGRLGGAVYPAASLIVSNLKCKSYGFNVCTDFLTSKTQVDMLVKIKIRPVFIIGAALKMVWVFLKTFAFKNNARKQEKQKKGETKNARSKNKNKAL